MPQIHVTDRQGHERAVEGQPGTSLMQTITDADFPELLALCGGMCSCATCHVYVDTEQLDRLPPIGTDEDELLAGSGHRRDNSRLSCQVRVTDALDGLRLTIAPEE